MVDIEIYKIKNKIYYKLSFFYKDIFQEISISELSWNKSNIINDLIRLKYSQDHVEAIINNHFLNIADWLDAKFKGEVVEFSDPEYEELQSWRATCKLVANEAIAIYPEY